jgi:hypothetical protein
MMKMLLRIQCAEHGVAPKLVANGDDLEAMILNPEGDLPVLTGWRNEIFGQTARKTDGRQDRPVRCANRQIIAPRPVRYLQWDMHDEPFARYSF